MTLVQGVARPAIDRNSSRTASKTVRTESRLAHVPRLSAGKRNSGNSLIQGDNLDVLNELQRTHAGRVRCAYLDPPYNNGDSYEHYLDRMGHEEWLASAVARLERIKPLLSATGSLWISIDDSELHYLKVAADGVFSRDNFVGTIVWERRTTRENRKVLSRNHEYILIYAKDIERWESFRNSLPLTDDIRQRYKNPDSDPRGPWQSISANAQDGHATPQQYYTLKAPNGRLHNPPKGRCWVYTKSKMLEEIKRNRVWFGRDGNSVPRLKKYLKDRNMGVTPETLWRAADVGTTADAKKHLLGLFQEKNVFSTPKPEPLLRRILEISTNPGDLVLDAYLGSGTTTAVAHKMGRSYIGIENGPHMRTHCVLRMRQVIAGEAGGVSAKCSWTGGGGYNFYRLAD